MSFEYTVLENGFDFILLSLRNLWTIYNEKPDEQEKKRLMKYALLHASSGVELVLKYYLLQNHWTYIFSDMNSANGDAFQKGKFTSADLKTILERLENLCDVILTDEQKNNFLRLKKRRNNAEHFVLKESFEAIQASIHRSISSLIQVILQYYDLDDFNEKEDVMFAEIKDALRDLKQHYDDAKTIAQIQLERHPLGKYAMTCPECGEDFLICDDGVQCFFCDYIGSGKSAARQYIENIMNISSYSAIKDGGEFPQYACPECGEEALVMDVADKTAFCFSCGYAAPIDTLVFCAECNQPFEGLEDDGCICHTCLEKLVEND